MFRSLLFLMTIAACGCNREQRTDDTQETAAPTCTDDEGCQRWEICEDRDCVTGDRDNSFEEATTIFQVDDLDGDPSGSGFIAPAGDEDYYAYSSLGGEWIEIRTRQAVEQDDGVDTVVSVYTLGGQLHATMDEYATGSIKNWEASRGS